MPPPPSNNPFPAICSCSDGMAPLLLLFLAFFAPFFLCVLLPSLVPSLFPPPAFLRFRLFLVPFTVVLFGGSSVLLCSSAASGTIVRGCSFTIIPFNMLVQSKPFDNVDVPGKNKSPGLESWEMSDEKSPFVLQLKPPFPLESISRCCCLVMAALISLIGGWMEALG